MSTLEVPHLTSVRRMPEGGKHPWLASCDCGWETSKRLKAEAISAAELHWLSMPLVMPRGPAGG